ncbi:MAG: AMP-binding protein [Firmicutes bacterium]|nr:AMP-binding protein [Bacillota bacterium]
MSADREKYWYKDIREISTLKELLYGSQKLYPDNPAFWVKKKKGMEYEAISYTLLKHDVEALGTKLGAMGLLDGRIAVMGVGAYEWIVTYLAVAIGGGTVVPIDKELDSESVNNLLKTAECRTIFYTSSESEKINKIIDIDNRIIMEFYGDRTDINIPMFDCITIEEKSAMADLPGNAYIWKELVSDGELLMNNGELSFKDKNVDPDALSVLIFTSGTTGDPKGVMLSQRNITANIMDTCRIAHILPTDKTLSILPIHHTYECTFGMLLVLYRGASTAFCEGLKYITSNMKEAGNTVFIAVPLVLDMIYDRIWKQVKKLGKEGTLRKAIKYNNKLKAIGLDMSRVLFKQVHNELGGKLRMVITGAASISPNVLRGFEDLGIIVLQGYGLTECTPLVSGTPQTAKERYKKAGSVGVAVSSGDIKIINKDESGIGEILFKGPNLMLGYYNMPEETAKVMKDGWFVTGDLGFVDRDGWLYLTGRSKNVIINKTGENIYPEEIEEVINNIPAVLECMVYADSRDNEEVVAVQIMPNMEVVIEELGHEPDSEELYKYIKNLVNESNMTMTSYKRVKKVIIRKEDFVRTTTKKIKRQENI